MYINQKCKGSCRELFSDMFIDRDILKKYVLPRFYLYT